MGKSKLNLLNAIFKSGILSLLSGICLWLFNYTNQNKNYPKIESESKLPSLTALTQPATNSGSLIQHSRFLLSYSEKHEQAEWVAYELEGNNLTSEQNDRNGLSFTPDPNVMTDSANPADYSGSGYHRGHLCPAADMAFDPVALRETFYMSNISPQTKAFNVGVWKEIESKTRNWAKSIGKITVITGPILSKQGIDQIGPNKVTVPVGFFKIIYAPKLQKAIGFVVPNQRTEKNPMRYAFNIDYIESITNINFFPSLAKDIETSIESNLDLLFWENS